MRIKIIDAYIEGTRSGARSFANSDTVQLTSPVTRPPGRRDKQPRTHAGS